MDIDETLTPADLQHAIEETLEVAAVKCLSLDRRWKPEQGAPVFTVRGRYTARGWTEWTQGFQFGAALLLFDGTGDAALLDLGRRRTLGQMAGHLTHVGVHDHGFNTISTFGNLRRLQLEGRVPVDALDVCELAIKVSGAVQAARWTQIHDGTGFIHSFNGPHSLFSDTIRSLRVLVLAHQLGHTLLGENDCHISLLQRAVEHLQNTARYNVFFGDGRDMYDVRGRVAHEGIFNTRDGNYRCPGTQQGYSPFSTWTRGLAWVLLGSAELLEYFKALKQKDAGEFDLDAVRSLLEDTARATADFYIANTTRDGIPYWDTGAPGLGELGDWRGRNAEPDNAWEPVDSSAAAIAAQGLLRLGHVLGRRGQKFRQAGLHVARTLFSSTYASRNPKHEGLLLHSIYHRPNGWDYVPPGKQVPHGEACMWGDYHLLELAVYLQRLAAGAPYLKFW